MSGKKLLGFKVMIVDDGEGAPRSSNALSVVFSKTMVLTRSTAEGLFGKRTKELPTVQTGDGLSRRGIHNGALEFHLPALNLDGE